MSSIDTNVLGKIFSADSPYSKNYDWVAIAGCIILGFGQEPAIRQLLSTLLEQTKSSNDGVQLKAVHKLREALLKASPLVGFPRSINGLLVFRQTLEEQAPELAKSLENDKSMRDPISLDQRKIRGKEFFSKIYAQHTERVLDSMNKTSGGDLGEFAVNCIYGDLMAETRILGAMETGLMEFAACLTLMATPQAKG